MKLSFQSSHNPNFSEDNLDSYFFDESRGIFLLTDGINNRVGGKISSTQVVTSVLDFFNRNYRKYGDPGSLLVESFYFAHRSLREKVQPDEGVDPYCSAALAYIERGRLFFAWAGNVRIYHFRDSTLTRLTTDHTLYEEGRKTKGSQFDFEESDKFALTNVLGKPGVVVELGEPIPLQNGDLLLLVSDGLYRKLTEVRIGKILAKNRNSELLAKNLMLAAESGMATEGMTVLGVKLEKGDCPLGINGKVVPFPGKVHSGETTIDQHFSQRTIQVPKIWLLCTGFFLIGVLIAGWMWSTKRGRDGKRGPT